MALDGGIHTGKDKASVREARRQLADKVRNDWDETLARALAPGPARDHDDLHTAGGAAAWRDDADVEWRERTYASSDSTSWCDSGDDVAEVEPAPASAEATPRRRTVPYLMSPRRRALMRHHSLHPDGSDADGDSSAAESQPPSADDGARRVELRKQARGRRRHDRLAAEMAWNPGLRHWQQTRDIWCGAQHAHVDAVGRRVARLSVPAADDLNSSGTLLGDSDTTATPVSSAGTSLSSVSAVPNVSDADKAESTTGDSTVTVESTATARASTPPPPLPARPAHLDGSADLASHPPSASVVTLIAVAPPLMPDSDPARQNIATQYKQIYDRCVVESLRPQVPINLAHLVPAMVQGWKATGEWPPKEVPPGVPRKARPIGGTAFSRRAKTDEPGSRTSAFGAVASRGRRLLGLGRESKEPKETAPAPPRSNGQAAQASGQGEAGAAREAGAAPAAPVPAPPTAPAAQTDPPAPAGHVRRLSRVVGKALGHGHKPRPSTGSTAEGVGTATSASSGHER